MGAAEANPRDGKISIESPLGKALLGAKVGDKVKIKYVRNNLTKEVTVTLAASKGQ